MEFKQRYTKKMTEVLGKEAVARYEKPTLEYPGKRCGMCLEEIIGHKKQRKQIEQWKQFVTNVNTQCVQNIL